MSHLCASRLRLDDEAKQDFGPESFAVTSLFRAQDLGAGARRQGFLHGGI